MSDIEKQRLFVLVGVPGSGKTTLAKKMIESLQDNTVHISRDSIRNEIGDALFNKKSEANVFKVYIERIATALKLGYDVIADSTNISKDKRVIYFALCEVLEKANLANVDLIAIFASTPLSVCIERNNERHADKVPEEVIELMHSKIEEPSYDEGFRIIMHKN